MDDLALALAVSDDLAQLDPTNGPALQRVLADYQRATAALELVVGRNADGHRFRPATLRSAARHALGHDTNPSEPLDQAVKDYLDTAPLERRQSR